MDQGQKQAILDGIGAALDTLPDDTLTCPICGVVTMDFRVDQVTFIEPSMWKVTAIIRQDAGWVSIVQDGKKIGLVCPDCAPTIAITTKTGDVKTVSASGVTLKP